MDSPDDRDDILMRQTGTLISFPVQDRPPSNQEVQTGIGESTSCQKSSDIQIQTDCSFPPSLSPKIFIVPPPRTCCNQDNKLGTNALPSLQQETESELPVNSENFELASSASTNNPMLLPQQEIHSEVSTCSMNSHRSSSSTVVSTIPARNLSVQNTGPTCASTTSSTMAASQSSFASYSSSSQNPIPENNLIYQNTRPTESDALAVLQSPQSSFPPDANILSSQNTIYPSSQNLVSPHPCNLSFQNSALDVSCASTSGATAASNADLANSRNCLHSKEREKKSFICPHCNKDYQHQSTLLRHIVKHTNEKRFFCKYCKSAFKSQGARDNHIHRYHKESQRSSGDHHDQN